MPGAGAWCRCLPVVLGGAVAATAGLACAGLAAAATPCRTSTLPGPRGSWRWRRSCGGCCWWSTRPRGCWGSSLERTKTRRGDDERVQAWFDRSRQVSFLAGGNPPSPPNDVPVNLQLTSRCFVEFAAPFKRSLRHKQTRALTARSQAAHLLPKHSTRPGLRTRSSAELFGPRQNCRPHDASVMQRRRRSPAHGGSSAHTPARPRRLSRQPQSC